MLDLCVSLSSISVMLDLCVSLSSISVMLDLAQPKPYGPEVEKRVGNALDILFSNCTTYSTSQRHGAGTAARACI